jgi:D-aminoacyl-tRNA deacylase
VDGLIVHVVVYEFSCSIGFVVKLVIQRVLNARVMIEGRETASIGHGAVVLVGVAKGDTVFDGKYLARKTSQLRMFDDEEGRLNNSIHAIQGDFLVVSQFTLYADCSQGNRPGYTNAAAPDEATPLYDDYVRELSRFGREVKTGVFGANMRVELVNDGPVTIIMESKGRTAL